MFDIILSNKSFIQAALGVSYLLTLEDEEARARICLALVWAFAGSIYRTAAKLPVQTTFSALLFGMD